MAQRLLGPLLAVLAQASAAPDVVRVPDRPGGALSGSEFVERIGNLGREERERAILAALQQGNFPSFLRRLVPVRIEAQDETGRRRRATVRVMPDVLAIGSDGDFVRMPMTPATAQAFCDAAGLAFPTRKIVEEVWRRAGRKLWPQPLVDAREAPGTFLRHHRIIEEQLSGTPRATLVGGHKKDLVVTNRLREQPGRVAIFGWHKPTGEAIQPLSLVHVEAYVDYSHGVRPLARQVEIDGRAAGYEAILRDAQLHVLFSDEGPIERPRYAAGR